MAKLTQKQAAFYQGVCEVIDTAVFQSVGLNLAGPIFQDKALIKYARANGFDDVAEDIETWAKEE